MLKYEIMNGENIFVENGGWRANWKKQVGSRNGVDVTFLSPRAIQVFFMTNKSTFVYFSIFNSFLYDSEAKDVGPAC